MASTTLVSVREYLATNYRPDRDYVDGKLLERNVGEWDHSRLQALLLKALLKYEEELGVLVVPEQRVQVRASRFRVPDLCVVRGNPGEQILTRPPLLCIEILSPEDAMSAMQERIDDFLAFGVENVWIFDPRRRKAYWADSTGVHEATTGTLEATGAPIRLDLHALWASLTGR
ncbi:MAG: Uma2 family endonuclease [Acidobacteriaceae bacterium]|nr:Uma2 family endonuclease [Acidobacteriaceae bacterium]MBV9502512.1 Uma2 family endonuclease [Acidobacteriaceae bacterium]